MRAGNDDFCRKLNPPKGFYEKELVMTNTEKGGQQGSSQQGLGQKGGGPSEQGAGKTTGQQGSPQGGKEGKQGSAGGDVGGEAGSTAGQKRSGGSEDDQGSKKNGGR